MLYLSNAPFKIKAHHNCIGDMAKVDKIKPHESEVNLNYGVQMVQNSATYVVALDLHIHAIFSHQFNDMCRLELLNDLHEYEIKFCQYGVKHFCFLIIMTEIQKMMAKSHGNEQKINKIA